MSGHYRHRDFWMFFSSINSCDIGSKVMGKMPAPAPISITAANAKYFALNGIKSATKSTNQFYVNTL
jgi:hypothetical protein